MSKISNNKIIISSILFFFLFVLLVFAADLNLKLPYPEDEIMLVTQGYDTGTHKGRDKYALDFTQNKCVAYGKPVLAVADGKVDFMVFETEKEGKSCGNGVKLDHGNNIKSLYCHLSKIEIDQIRQHIKQGELVGYIGNSGYVIGNICKDYPGTHLHFSMRQHFFDGKIIPYKPEPMSGYTNFVARKWYKSDNKLVEKPKEVVKEKPLMPKEISLLQKIKNIPQSISKSVSNFFAEKKEQVENAIERQVEKTKRGIERKIKEMTIRIQKRIEREVEKQVEKQMKEMEKACAIKAAVVGSPLENEIDILRDFRDGILLKSSFGRNFVNFYYYRFSPPAVNFMLKYPNTKMVLNEIVIEPAIRIVEVTENIWDK